METGKIGNIVVNIEAGDITHMSTDAYVVPQLTSVSFYSGLGGVVALAGGQKGFDLYQAFIDESGEQKFGTVLLTESGGGNARYHLHVASVGSPREHEFNTIKTAIFNALKVAVENGIRRIHVPALGTGFVGQLSTHESAKAMMAGVFDFFNEEGNRRLEITFVIYAASESDPDYRTFCDVLRSGDYEDAGDEPGHGSLGMNQWIVGMHRDADANRRGYRDE